MRPPSILRLSVPPREPAGPAPPAPPEAAADQVLAFIGFFNQRLQHLRTARSAGGLSKTEIAVVTALGRRPALASELSRRLAIDQGYLSRIVKRLVALGLAERTRGEDARQSPISATAGARALLRRLDRDAADAVSQLLRPLSRSAADELVAAMARLREILKPPPAPPPGDEAAPLSSPPADVHLRALRGGDVALVAHRLAVLHRQGSGFDAPFERRLLARAAAFLEDFDRARDIGWIAERHGRLAGVCLLKGVTGDMAELSIIHVEPEVLGIGLARMLLDHCLAFAELAKYSSVTARVAGGEDEIAGTLEELEFSLVRREETAAPGLEWLWEKRL